MTRNQIEYQKLLEQRRANLQNEAISQYKSYADVDLRAQELTESRRHNLQVESVSNAELGIKGKQAQAALQNAEANTISAKANWRNAVTNERNAATNEQNAISNRMQAQASLRTSEAAVMQANVAERRAVTEAYQLQESVRHNLIAESQASTKLDLESQNVEVSKTRNELESRRISLQNELESRRIDLQEKELPIKQQNANAQTSRAQAENFGVGSRAARDLLIGLTPLAGGFSPAASSTFMIPLG